MPDLAEMTRARAAAHAEWSRLVARRGRRRSAWVMSAAALAGSVAGIAIWSLQLTSNPVATASR